MFKRIAIALGSRGNQILGAIFLGDIKRMQGKLTEATALYNEASLLNRR